MIPGALRDTRRRAVNARVTKFSFLCSKPTAWHSREFATAAPQGPTSATQPAFPGDIKPQFDRLKKYRRPETTQRVVNEDAAAFKHFEGELLDYLDECLPPYLRSNSGDDDTPYSARESLPTTATTRRIVRIIEDANASFTPFFPWLAIRHGRWKAAVWIVKLLIESYHAELPRSNRLAQTVQQWERTESLSDITQSPLYLVPRDGQMQTPHIKRSSAPSLHALTDDRPDTLSSKEVNRHQVLGLVWEGIGRLIIACANDPQIAGGAIKPEILEMIALLHHYELVSSSVYSYQPSQNEDAIQQPPTLQLLSSRIFTALSDATWKAREMTAVEEARQSGRDPSRLEAMGSSYRVRVSSVKLEVWFELILWSCLHGGWISEGASLLDLACKGKKKDAKWKAISWRDTLRSVMPFGEERLLDWDSIKFIFDTQSSATMDGVDASGSGLRVEGTISSEVVDAYIDAILNYISYGVGTRGLPLTLVLSWIRNFRNLLQRSNLNLGGGSWDAILVRIAESGAFDLEWNASTSLRFAGMAPNIGEELASRRSQVLPTYVLDGSAAILGFMHRALRAEIKSGNLEGALKAFEYLQRRVDHNRSRSLADFFEHMRVGSVDTEASSRPLFNSNFTGIEFPLFDTQVPVHTLAALLDLATDNKAFDVGAWMLTTQDVDGPTITEDMYSNPAISAALVRFATAANNMDLLMKVVRVGTGKLEDADTAGPIPKELLKAFLDAQIELKQWDSAERILEYMRDTPGFQWSANNVATLATQMLLETDTGNENYTRASTILSKIVAGSYGHTHTGPHRVRHSRATARLHTLYTILSSVDARLAALIEARRKLPSHIPFTISSRVFSTVLRGVVASRGSVAGVDLVNTFLPAERGSDDLPQRGEAVQYTPYRAEDSKSKFARGLPRSLHAHVGAENLPRKRVRIQNERGTEVAVYGGLSRVTVTMVKIVVQQAMREEKTAERREVLVWAVDLLMRGGFRPKAVLRGLQDCGVYGEELEIVEERVKTQLDARLAEGEGLEDDGEGEDKKEQEEDEDDEEGDEEEKREKKQKTSHRPFRWDSERSARH